jgi:hypothetical protein
MTKRLLVGLLVLVGLLAGCSASPATQPAATTMNDTVQTAAPGQAATPTASNPDLATEAATTGSIESDNNAATLVPETLQPRTTVDVHCTETDPHPIAQSIAETYHTTYEEVMTFFCTGVGFEDIVLAYQTADLAGITADEALTLWYDFGNWEDVWIELGLE